MTEILNTKEQTKKNDNVHVEQKIVGRVSKNELDSINIRNNIIDSKQIEINLLKQERDTFFLELQNKHKLSSGKEYLVDKEGKIIETIKI